MIQKVDNNKMKGSMTEGSPVRCMVTFVVTMILGNLCEECYNLRDYESAETVCP